MAGLLERALAFRAVNVNDDRYWGEGGGGSRSGVTVTADTALTYSAFFACVSVIAEDESTLPLPAFQRRGDSRLPRPDHQAHFLLNEQPNEKQTAQEFREWMTAVSAMRGEALARIIGGRGGHADQLEPLDPNHLRKEKLPSGSVRYKYRRDGQGVEETFLPDEVFRLPGRLGLSVVTLAKETLGAALAGDRFTSAMWKNGIRPRMALQHPGAMSPKAQQNLRDSIDFEHGGADNAGRTMIFEEGMTWVKVGIDPKDAQFLESRNFSVEEVCRWFRMQPHKIAHLLRSTNNNIEHQGIEHVTDTIRPWCVRWEQAAKVQLITEPDIYVRHNMDALLRGDALTTAQALEVERRNGIINANEWRALKERNPRDDPGGDTYWDTQPGTGSGNPANGKAVALAEAAAGRVVQREKAAMARKGAKYATASASDSEAWAEWRSEVEGFYLEHRGFVRETLHLSESVAVAYCDGKAEEVLSEGLGCIERWDARDIPGLAEMALGGVA